MEKSKSKVISPVPTSVVRWLWQTIRGKRCYILGLLLLQIGLSLSAIGYSLLFRRLIDEAVAAHRTPFLLYLSVMIGLTVLQLTLRAVNRWLEEAAKAGFENVLKHRLFDTLLRRDYASVTATHSGEWMNRLTSDTVVVANGLAQIIPNLGGMLVKMVGAFAAILVLEPVFGVLILPAGLALLVITRLFRPALKRLHSLIQQSDGVLRVFLQERLDNLLIVHTFSQQDRSADLADGHMDRHKTARMRRNKVVNACNIGFGVAMQGIYLLGTAICGIGIINGEVTFGTLTAVLQLIGQLQGPFAGFSGYLSQWYAMVASGQRLQAAEELPPDPDGEAVPEEQCRQFYRQQFAGLRVEALDFSYADPAGGNGGKGTLRNLNFELAKGEFVCVVGHSGCGKSTLLKLLMCIYRPDSGRILAKLSDSQDSRRLTGADRRLFAYVPQGNQLMSGTIRQVVAFYEEEKMARDEPLWNALKIACADEFVSQLPLGLDTPLGEHGQGLSEGQIQRLAVARAVFSGRPVLLLDEATSSLDEATEEKLLQNLRTMTDRTVVIVTHRPRAWELCDRVWQL